MGKKSIDELFKERFNDFAEIPDPKSGVTLKNH